VQPAGSPARSARPSARILRPLAREIQTTAC
jgi:hypothetical protein